VRAPGANLNHACMTDQPQLLVAARQGDPEALAQLVARYHDRVYRYGQRMCRDRFDADDAVQDAFATLARRPDVQHHPGVIAWLFAVVRNACRRLLRPRALERRRLGEPVADHDAVAALDPSPHQALERWRIVDTVHAAIAALEPSLREILILRDLEGMTGEEACRALAISDAAMKSRLHRARAGIRDRLRHLRDEVG